jgi:hypothetical protein
MTETETEYPATETEPPVVISTPLAPRKKKLALHNIISRSPTCLSLIEGKIARFAVAYAQQCREQSRRDKEPEQIYFTIKLSDLTKWIKVKPNEYMPEFENMAKRIINWRVLPQLREPGETVYYDLAPFFSRVKFSKDKNGDLLVTYGFPPHLLPLFMAPSFYRIFELSTIQKIQSKYTLQLYSYLYSCLPKGKNEYRTEFITVQQMRALLGCENTYQDLRVFNRDVLKPALDGLQAMTEVSAGYLLDRFNGILGYQFIVWPTRNWAKEHKQELEQVLRLLRDPKKGAEFLATFVPPKHEVHEKEKEFLQALQCQVEEQIHREKPEVPGWEEWIEWFVAQPCRLTICEDQVYFVCSRSTQMIHIYGNYKSLVYSIAKSLEIPSVFFLIHDPRGDKKAETRRISRKRRPAKDRLAKFSFED